MVESSGGSERSFYKNVIIGGVALVVGSLIFYSVGFFKGNYARKAGSEMFSIEQTVEGNLLHKAYVSEDLERTYEDNFQEIPGMPGSYTSSELIEKLQELGNPMRAPQEKTIEEKAESGGDYLRKDEFNLYKNSQRELMNRIASYQERQNKLNENFVEGFNLINENFDQINQRLERLVPITPSYPQQGSYPQQAPQQFHPSQSLEENWIPQSDFPSIVPPQRANINIDIGGWRGSKDEGCGGKVQRYTTPPQGPTLAPPEGFAPR